MFLRDFIVYWNNKYQFDYWYRDKYQIGFNSPSHRQLKVFDVRVEYLENRLIEQERIRSHNRKKRNQVYDKTGRWLRRRESSEKIQKELFDKIVI